MKDARQGTRPPEGPLDGTLEGWRIVGRVRAAASLGALVLGAIALYYGRAPWTWGVVGMAVVSAVTAVPALRLPVGSASRRCLELAGAGLGTALCLCIVQAMGGVTGPFCYVFLVPVFAYGLNLGGAASYRIAATCSLVMGVLICWEIGAGASLRELLAPLSVVYLIWVQAYGVDSLTRHETARRAELVRLADLDPLTGVLNRRTLQPALEHSAARGERFALILLDLDGFKSVNDQLGHVRGDEVLRTVGQATLATVRRDDLVIRYGGDEFAILVKGGEEDARRVEERLHGAFASLGREMGISLDFSAGVAVWPEDGATLARLLQVADGRLYENKPASRPIVVAQACP